MSGRTADTFCSLEGKTALVTGGSRGIGAAIARELAGAGATVTLSYRSGKDEAEAVAGEAGAKAVQADVSDADEAKRLDVLLDRGVTFRAKVVDSLATMVVIGRSFSSLMKGCACACRPH